MENIMIRVKVQYNAVQRTFKLIDEDFHTILEGDALYDLNIPVAMYDEADVENIARSIKTSIAHA
jgi:hypothetical protein